MTTRSLSPLVFDEARRAFLPRAAAREPLRESPSTRLTIATWNIWFGEYCFDARIRSLLDLLRDRSPDVVCLQEVTRASLAAIVAEPWVRAEYAVSDATGETFDEYGVLLLARPPVPSMSLRALPSSMGRALLAAELDAGGRRVIVATTHLESLRWNSDRRAEQLEHILPALRAMGADAVLVGDLNFCSSWPENENIDPDFVNLWPGLCRHDPGYTEDTDVNVMHHNLKQKTKRARINRVLLRSTTGALRPRSIELLGTAPISPASPDVFPSDHFGLLATLDIE